MIVHLSYMYDFTNYSSKMCIAFLFSAAPSIRDALCHDRCRMSVRLSARCWKFYWSNCTKFRSYIPYIVEICAWVQVLKNIHTFPQKVSKYISQSEPRNLKLQWALILLLNKDYSNSMYINESQ